MKTLNATAEHQAYRLELLEAMREVAARHKLSGEDLLAVTAHLVGGLIANMDQAKYTPHMCMDIVVANVTTGNEEALALLAGPSVGTA